MIWITANLVQVMVTEWQAGSGERPRYLTAKVSMETGEVMAKTAEIQSKMFGTSVKY
ncbi:MAG: hypothetical protein AAFR89_01215 [Cyanobacteria bacterium J06633_1]